jgi:DNA-binding beta-propeller fold protein YncE
MQRRKRPVLWFIGALLGYSVLVMAFVMVRGALASQSADPIVPAAPFTQPTYSSPISISQNNLLVWSVNPDDDSVSVIRTDTNTLVGNPIRVGDEPQSVALNPNLNIAYVANAADNTVTVIQHNGNPNAFTASVLGQPLTTGAEPWNIVISPDGSRLFVANSGQDTISVYNTAGSTPAFIGNVDLRNSSCNGTSTVERARHFQPRGMAVTIPVSGNAQLYVTRFLSFVKSGGVQGSDVGKEGVVCRLNFTINTATLPAVSAAIPIQARDTGFAIDANGDGTPDATSAYPNQLQSIVIRNGHAYLPNIAASPSRPLKFNTDTHAFVNRIDGVGGVTQTDGGAINLHLGARTPEAGKTKLFFANPWAIGFNGSNAYVVSAGSDLLVKLNVNAGTGALEFTGGAATTRYIDLNDPEELATADEDAGKNPLGIVINEATSRAYVMNYVSRNVSVVDLVNDEVTTVIKTGNLPPPGTLDEIIQVGKEMFFSSRGHFNSPAGTTVSTSDRLSSEGWQNCASCHFGGLTDGVVWQFGSGPRKSVPMNGTWNPHNRDDQRILNYSAIFEEVQDFEANIRNVSGPGGLNVQTPPKPPAPCATPAAGQPATSNNDPDHGLIIGDDGDINKAPCAVNNFAKPNEGRPQHTVTLPGSGVAVPALDALKEWVRFGIRTPNSPLTSAQISGGVSQTEINDGRRLFVRAGCVTCHGGGKWTKSSKDFISPPAATEVFAETDPDGAGPIRPNTGTYLDRFLEDIGSFDLNVPASPNQVGGGHPAIGAVEKDTGNNDALGKDYNGDGKGAGFNVPSLLGIHAVQPYYHNGACETLACVVADNDHRRAGLQGRPDIPQADWPKLVRFLESINAETPVPTNLYVDRHDIFFDPPAVIAGTTVNVGVNISLFGPRSDIAQPLTVKFYDGRPGAAGTTEIGTQTFSSADFNQDFGQATKTVPWNVPATPGIRFIYVEVDSPLPNGLLTEINEEDNTAGRRIRTRPTPPDRTPPTIDPASVQINDGDAITDNPNVTITFEATDPTSPQPQSTSGLDSFCVVRYTYDTIRRRWIEQNCNFQALPAANGDGSFTVSTQLRPREGTAYAFIWVKDKAGNISQNPGFDVISFIPSPTTDIELDRNDVRIFRITLDPGQDFKFDVTPSFGDVDLAVFQGNTRVAVSANNGTSPESVTFGNGTGTPQLFQVEVRAIVNSRFRITAGEVLAGLLRAAPDVIGPTKVVPTTPLVTGPPVKAAVEGAQDVMLPITKR